MIASAFRSALRIAAAAAAASLVVAAAGNAAHALNQRVTFGSAFEETAMADCTAASCLAKFNLLNTDILLKQVSCVVVFRGGSSGPSLYVMTEKPAKTIEYVSSLGVSNFSFQGLTYTFNQAMTHIILKGSNPLMKVTFDGGQADSPSMTCTIAGRSAAG